MPILETVEDVIDVATGETKPEIIFSVSDQNIIKLAVALILVVAIGVYLGRKIP